IRQMIRHQRPNMTGHDFLYQPILGGRTRRQPQKYPQEQGHTCARSGDTRPTPRYKVVMRDIRCRRARGSTQTLVEGRRSLEIQQRLFERRLQRVMSLLKLGAHWTLVQVSFEVQGADQIQLTVTISVQ